VEDRAEGIIEEAEVAVLDREGEEEEEGG